MRHSPMILIHFIAVNQGIFTKKSLVQLVRPLRKEGGLQFAQPFLSFYEHIFSDFS